MLEFIVLLLAGVLVCLIILIWQVALLQAALSKLARSLLPSDPLPVQHMHSFQMKETGFFVIWEWRGNRWRVAPGVVGTPGTEMGPEPAYPGTYEGDKVKTWVQTSR